MQWLFKVILCKCDAPNPLTSLIFHTLYPFVFLLLFVISYSLELDSMKNSINADTFKEPTQRVEAKKAIRKVFEEKYNSGKNKWFFTKLRF